MAMVMSSTGFTANPRRGPVLEVHPSAWEKILTLIDLCPGEVNGFGLISRVSPERLVLASAADVFITDQVISVASADVDAANVALALDWADQMDRGDDMRLQWHSHPCDAYFSGTDMRNIDAYGQHGAQWMASLVFDRHGGCVGRLDTFAPVRTSVEMTVRPMSVYGLEDECRGLLVQHVSREVYVGPHRPGHRRQTTTIGVFEPLPPGAEE